MYIAHGPLSYVLNERIQSKKISKLNSTEQLLVGLLSFLFGIFPDIDILLLSMTKTPPFLHHTLFSHSILFYLLLWIVLNGAILILKKVLNSNSKKVFNRELLDVIQLSFLIGVMSHLFADILFSHSRVLFPIKRQVTILGGLFQTNYFASYLFTPLFAIEIIILILFTLAIYKRYFKQKKVVFTLLHFTLGIITLFFSFNCYMNLQTYNRAYTFRNNKKVMDYDFDGIEDRYDSDIGNRGIKNIYRVDRKEMIRFVESISNDRYLVTNNTSWINKLGLYYGGFTSYRVISQAYREQNLAIEPVLREYAQEKYKLNSYTLKIPYSILLYEYILENGRETELNTPGGVLLVVNDNEIVNYGIVTNEDMVGIVFDSDKRLVLHTLESVRNRYEDMEFRTYLLE